MCHLILALPLLALALFWVLPLSEALPAYGLVFVVSVVVYRLVIRSMRSPVTTGREHLEHARGQVVASDGPGRYRVRVEGELWLARTAEVLEPKQEIIVTGLDGNVLHVSAETPSDPPKNTTTRGG